MKIIVTIDSTDKEVQEQAVAEITSALDYEKIKYNIVVFGE